MKKMLLGFVFGALAGGLSTAAASTFSCEVAGDRVCAVNSETGECSVSWSDRQSENPTFDCMRFMVQVSQPVTAAAGYSCRKMANGACVVNNATGNCTIQFPRKDYVNPMDTCRRFINDRYGGGNNSKEGYYCRRISRRQYCAVNPRTNKCVRYWENHRDDNDAQRLCESYVRN